jgi:hypothetical protein
MRFIFTSFSCKKNLIQNQNNLISFYNNWQLRTIIDSSSINSHTNILLRDLIYYYFGNFISDSHINSVI